MNAIQIDPETGRILPFPENYEIILGDILLLKDMRPGTVFALSNQEYEPIDKFRQLLILSTAGDWLTLVYYLSDGSMDTEYYTEKWLLTESARIISIRELPVRGFDAYVATEGVKIP